MTTVKLMMTMKSEFMMYAEVRRTANVNDNYTYLTAEILERTFEFFVAHKHAADEKGRTWYIENGKRNYISCGYSGYSSHERDDEEGMVNNLFHDVWCKAEWIARGERGGYSSTTQSFFGKEWYSRILGK